MLRLTLDRPDKRNALDDAMMAGLIDAVDAAGRDEAVRVIVLAGAGDHFCGGADIVARNARRASARPRVGSIQRRVPSQAHRLIPLVLHGAGAGRVRGCRAGRPASASTSRWPADFTVAADDATLLGAVRRAGLHARQRRAPGCCRAWSAMVRARELLLLGREAHAAPRRPSGG